MPLRASKISDYITDRDLLLSKYFDDIRGCSFLTIDEEIELGMEIMNNGPKKQQAINKLVEGNLRFVISIAKQFKVKNISLPDLISEGNLGLVRAAQTYDPTKGFKFITFAVWWIRQPMLEFVKRQCPCIRIPESKYNIWRKIKNAQERYLIENGYVPDANTLSELTGFEPEKINSVLSYETSIISLDSPVLEEDPDSKRSDYISDETFRTDKRIESHDLERDMAVVMRSVLKPRERRVLSSCYGINRGCASLNAIAESEDITRERARQIKETAIIKLQNSRQKNRLCSYLG